jgi:hypothetical protein
MELRCFSRRGVRQLYRVLGPGLSWDTLREYRNGGVVRPCVKVGQSGKPSRSAYAPANAMEGGGGCLAYECHH